MSRLILGINSAHADSSAALVGEGGLIAAIAEERINRKKHCADFPVQAIHEVLRIAGASLSDITDIAVARNPQANLAAKAAFVARYPRGGMEKALKRLKVHREVKGSMAAMADQLGCNESQLNAELHHVEHHLAHIASAYFGSPLERATGISVDGAGDFATNMTALCQGNRIDVLHRTHWPHSLGVYYTGLCQFIGFDRFGEEYKVMGLSAYGVNRYARELKKLVTFSGRRGLELNLKYFCHQQASEGLEMFDDGSVRVPRLYHERMSELFGEPRHRDDPVTDRDRNIAASMQFRFEEVYLDLVAAAVEESKCRDVTMAGGSVLNSVANGRMLTERVVDRAFFHPAASDDGTAVGAALYTLHQTLGVTDRGVIDHAYWGSEFKDDEIEPVLQKAGVPFKKLSRAELLDTASTALSQGKICGWFQGREEWGPRALGNRSILCHPGWPDMKATLNARIKNREPFRPFAPAILREKLSTCFHGEHDSPFMIVVYKVRPEWRERLSAVAHEDGTGRVQTVTRDQNALYYDLIETFEGRTGIPVLLNTSFNENEPVVHTPEQAFNCFMRTRMDSLALGSFWLEKSDRG